MTTEPENLMSIKFIKIVYFLLLSLCNRIKMLLFLVLLLLFTVVVIVVVIAHAIVLLGALKHTLDD